MRLIFLVLLTVGTVAAQTPLDQLNWMGGCWQAGTGTRVSIELWSVPAGGMMVGAGRTVVAGQTREFEHLRIRAEGDGLVYTAIPSGQTEADFRSVAVGDSGFTVENLQHDFPQRLIYRRSGPDAMTVRVEGPGRAFDVAFTRVRCEAADRPGACSVLHSANPATLRPGGPSGVCNAMVTYNAEFVFHALADPTRREILDLLRVSEQACRRPGEAVSSEPASGLAALARAQGGRPALPPSRPTALDSLIYSVVMGVMLAAWR